LTLLTSQISDLTSGKVCLCFAGDCSDEQRCTEVAHFYIISQQSFLINVEKWRDPTIQSLYRYARDVVEDIATEKEPYL
jgi:hypothetical protein